MYAVHRSDNLFYAPPLNIFETKPNKSRICRSILMAGLAQCLVDTLNPDTTIRIKAELRLSELFLDPSTLPAKRHQARV